MVRKLIFILYTLLNGYNLYAQDTIAIQSPKQKVDLKSHLYFYEDAQANITLPAIQKKTFSPIASTYFYSKISKSAFWLRFNLKNTHQQEDIEYIFSLTDPSLYLVEMYVIDKTGKVSYQKTGISIPAIEKQYFSNSPALLMHLRPHEAIQVYIRFTSKVHIRTNIQLIAELDYNRGLIKSYTIFGFFYGLVCIVFFYNILLYFASGLKDWLYLALFTVFMALLTGTLDGFTPQFLPFIVRITKGYYDVFTAAGAIFFNFLFVKSYLDIPKIAPKRCKQIYNYLTIIPLFLIILNLIVPEWAANLTVNFSLLLLPFFLVCLYWAWRAQMREAIFYGSAFILFGFGLIFNSLPLYLNLHTSWLSQYGLHFAMIAQLLMLSLGISDKISQIRRQSLRKEQENQQIIREKNQELETKVAERTYELALKEANLKSVIESTNEQIYSLDRNFNLLVLNQATRRMIKERYKVELEVGQNLLEKLPDEIVQVLLPNFEKALQGEFFRLSGGFTYRNLEIFREITFNPMFNEQGEITGISVFVKDITEEETIRRELKDNEELLNNIFEESLDALFLVDAENQRIMRCNKMAIQMFGFSDKSELLGTQGIQLHKIPLTKQEIEEIAYSIENQQYWANSYEYITKQGKVFWGALKINGFYLKEKSYRLVRISDITTQKQIEQQLLDKETNLRAILDNNSYAIWLINQKFELIDFNNIFKEYYHNYYKIIPYPNLNILEVSPPDSRQIWRSRYEKALLGEPCSFLEEYPYQGKTQVFSIKMYPIRKEEQIIGISVFAQNITKKIQFEKQLGENQQLLASINQHVKEGLYRSTPEGKLIYANRAFKEMFGYELDTDNIPIEDLYASPIERNVLLKILDVKGYYNNEEVIFKRKNGDKFWGLISTTKNINDNGEVYYDGAIRDISEVKRAEQKLKQQNQALKKVNSELDKFVYSASHDLRAPLSSILGLIDIAKLASTENDRERYYQLMSKSVKRLDEFIQQIIHYSRNARQSVKRELIDFEVVINNSFDNLKYMPNSEKIIKNIQLDLETPFYSDNFRLSVIFNNIISNAIRYSNSQQVQPKIDIKTQINHQTAIIEISDNGQGIDEKYLPHIFKMFYKANEKNTGSGLGLYIVKESLEALKGTIQVRSTLNKGTSFIFEIPNLIEESNDIQR